MKSIINKILSVTSVGLLVSNLAFAESKTNFDFEIGSAVILCDRSEPVPEPDFVKVFGHWQTYLVNKRDEGVVYLSQFTQALNKGLRIVVNKHELIDDNVKEAEQMLVEMNKIAEDKGVERDQSSCKIMAMGPIWLAPIK